MAEVDHTGNTNPGVIPDLRESGTFKVDFKTAASVLAVVVLALVQWFGMAAQVTAANTRIDKVEMQAKVDKDDTDREMAHLTKVVCAVAKKVGAAGTDCD